MEDKRFKELCDEALKTYIAKNTDYGNSFTDAFEEFGIISAIVRMNDKMMRLKSLCKKQKNEVKDESIIDTLKDLANYSLMTVIELEKESRK
jgi:lipid II:glycine glycyltransferase (peptidoglycan interpeptide bridge formation enzyme)